MTPGRDETQPLDPAAIMAAHQPGDTGQFCLSCIGGVDEDTGVARVVEHDGFRLRLDYVLPAPWPCEPYRLAAALAAAQERLAQVIATLDSVDPTRSASIMLTAVYRAVGVSPHRDLRAALAGEGQPCTCIDGDVPGEDDRSCPVHGARAADQPADAGTCGCLRCEWSWPELCAEHREGAADQPQG